MSSNGLTVRNATGVDLPPIHVVLRRMDGRLVLDKTIPGLEPGSSATIREAFSEASIEFQSQGSVRRFESRGIDFWTGEGWVLEIQPDGSVKEGYDYPGFPLR